MFVLAIISLILAVVFFFVASLAKRSPYNDFRRTSHGFRNAAVISIILIPVFLLFASFRTVTAGYVGVQRLFGKVQTDPLTEGLHIVNPLFQVEQMSVQTQTYTMSASQNEGNVKGNDAISIITSDGLTINVEVSIPFHLNTFAAPWVYRNFGVEYVDQIIRPAIRSALRAGFSKFTAQDLYSTKREEAAAVASKYLQNSVNDIVKRAGFDKGEAINVQDILFRDIELPKSVKDAIELKITSQQEAERMDFVLAKESKEAERKKIEAEGIKNFQQIVTQGITPSLLTWKGIEATEKLAASPNSKIIIIGGKNGLPVILNGAGQ